MKKKISFIVMIASALVLFSSCELLLTIGAMKALGDSIVDYNAVYVKNATGATISLKYEEDESSVEEGETLQSGKYSIGNGATKKQAFSGGTYLKLTIDGIQVLPDENASDSCKNKSYYFISANSLLTITGNAVSGYEYSVSSRSSLE